eukprot:PhM_4_TR18660/c3_g1_i2/m.19875
MPDSNFASRNSSNSVVISTLSPSGTSSPCTNSTNCLYWLDRFAHVLAARASPILSLSCDDKFSIVVIFGAQVRSFPRTRSSYAIFATERFTVKLVNASRGTVRDDRARVGRTCAGW